MDSKILDLAKKLNELAKQGEGGEKQNAADMLERIMKKHGITWDMLDSSVPKERIIYYDLEQKDFLFQVISSVIRDYTSYYYKADKRKTKKIRLAVLLTDVQYIEVIEKFEFYWEKWQRDKADFYSAYIQKHKLYRKPSDNPIQDNKPMTPEEKERLLKMLRMMDAIDEGRMVKRIEYKK